MIPLPKASTIYISGPMSGLHAYNFKAFFYHQVLLEKAGFCVINPAEIDTVKMFNGWQYTPDQWEELIEEDCMLIRTRCQGVFVLKGYESSKGALREIACALENNIPVFYESDF